MRTIRYNFLLVVGLVLTFGFTTAMAAGDHDSKKSHKGMGTLTVRTVAGPVSYS